MIWYTEIFIQLKYFHNQRQNYFLTVVEVVLVAGSHEHQVALLEDRGVVRYPGLVQLVSLLPADQVVSQVGAEIFFPRKVLKYFYPPVVCLVDELQFEPG